MGCVNELLVLLLEVGYLAAVFGGLNGFSGMEEDAQDRAVGPH